MNMPLQKFDNWKELNISIVLVLLRADEILQVHFKHPYLLCEEI